MGSPRVSIILATHNRREVVLQSLREIRKCELSDCDYEVIIVDNASVDGTPQAVADHVNLLIPLHRNRGSCAKAWAVDVARGDFIVFLDDDSYPHPGSLVGMIRHFEADSRLACAGFQVHLPEGGRESSALHGVFVGCGAGFRAEALRAVGGLDRTFFMQAEEYDLSFRLAAAGWGVEVFDDLHVTHLKTNTARRSARTIMFDVRNNLRVAARYLRQPKYDIYRDDWLQRYSWLAGREGHDSAVRRGRLRGNLLAMIERPAYAKHRLSDAVFERFFRWHHVAQEMEDLVAAGIRRILFADLGKNIYAFHRGAMIAGLHVVGIADDRFARPGRAYRGIPIMPRGQALLTPHDAIVLSNMSFVHAGQTLRYLRDNTMKPVFSWFHAGLPQQPRLNLPAALVRPDDIAVGEIVGSGV